VELLDLAEAPVEEPHPLRGGRGDTQRRAVVEQREQRANLGPGAVAGRGAAGRELRCEPALLRGLRTRLDEPDHAAALCRAALADKGLDSPRGRLEGEAGLSIRSVCPSLDCAVQLVAKPDPPLPAPVSGIGVDV
jgi:hypothetical protein